MIEAGTHASWLLSCPCGDGNFKIHLKDATIEDLKEVLGNLPDEGNKTKKKVLATELKKREKSARASTTP